MQILLMLIVLTAIITFFYMRQAKFGKLPAGERLARIEKSPHYKETFLNAEILHHYFPSYLYPIHPKYAIFQNAAPGI